MCRLGLYLAIALAAGCSSAVQTGKSTALDGADLVAMTDDMSMKILGDPDVQSAITAEGQLRVVVQPVENEMTAEILPKGPSEAFTGRLRAMLSKHAPDRFIWVMNKDAYYRLRARELEYDLGPSPEAINPKYALVARFSSLTTEDPRHRASYYLCVYQLTDLQTRKLLWTDKYEVKKTAVKGFLD